MEMKKIYVKHFFEEENIWFFYEIIDGWACRQVEIWPNESRFLSEKIPHHKDSMLADQKFEDLNSTFDEKNFISAQDFEEQWNKRLRSKDDQ
mgnify:CR=1 FL=1